MPVSGHTCIPPRAVARLVQLKVAAFELGLRTFTSRATNILKSCDFRGGAAEVIVAYTAFVWRLSRRGCGSLLCVLLSR